MEKLEELDKIKEKIEELKKKKLLEKEFSELKKKGKEVYRVLYKIEEKIRDGKRVSYLDIEDELKKIGISTDREEILVADIFREKLAPSTYSAHVYEEVLDRFFKRKVDYDKDKKILDAVEKRLYRVINDALKKENLFTATTYERILETANQVKKYFIKDLLERGEYKKAAELYEQLGMTKEAENLYKKQDKGRRQ